MITIAIYDYILLPWNKLENIYSIAWLLSTILVDHFLYTSKPDVFTFIKPQLCNCKALTMTFVKPQLWHLWSLNCDICEASTMTMYKYNYVAGDFLYNLFIRYKAYQLMKSFYKYFTLITMCNNCNLYSTL